MKWLRMVAAATALMVATGGLDAKVRQDKSFRFPAGQPARIIVFRPDVQVGSMGAGGVDEPNPDWTVAARANLMAQLAANQRASGNEVIFLPEQEGANAQLVADYQALFRAVAGAVVEHQMNAAARLPTKGNRFDWTLGPGTQQLAAIGHGDYGLFLWTHDSYGSAARKVMQVLVAGLFRAAMPAGIHQGYAALVDLKTGALVWLNVDPASGGDPRDHDGAAKRVNELLTGFPHADRPVPTE